MNHTRRFLREDNRKDGRGDLPQGIVHTTLGATGAYNAAAEAFKKEALDRLQGKGFVVAYAFGNRKSDVATKLETTCQQVRSRLDHAST